MKNKNLYEVDIETGQRIGQYIWNQFAKQGLWEAPEANILFYIPDEELIKILKNESKETN